MAEESGYVDDEILDQARNVLEHTLHLLKDENDSLRPPHAFKVLCAAMVQFLHDLEKWDAIPQDIMPFVINGVSDSFKLTLTIESVADVLNFLEKDLVDDS